MNVSVTYLEYIQYPVEYKQKWDFLANVYFYGLTLLTQNAGPLL